MSPPGKTAGGVGSLLRDGGVTFSEAHGQHAQCVSLTLTSRTVPGPTSSLLPSPLLSPPPCIISEDLLLFIVRGIEDGWRRALFTPTPTSLNASHKYFLILYRHQSVSSFSPYHISSWRQRTSSSLAASLRGGMAIKKTDANPWGGKKSVIISKRLPVALERLALRPLSNGGGCTCDLQEKC
jgi:hypothetical protein